MMWIIGVIVLVYIAAVDGYSSRALKFHQGNKILQPSCRLRPTSVLQQSTTAAASFGDSELPNDFIDSVDRAVESTVRCMSTGVRRCRVDFDTTVGDMTYTSLKNSLPFTEEFVKRLAYRLGYAVPEVIKEEGDEEASKAIEGEASEASPSLPVEPPQAIVPTEIIKIFFPDMGAAALARKDWKLNEDEPKLPNCVVTANIKNDPIQSKDKLVIMLCPQYSEADSVKRVIQLCDDEGTPCILVNPNIINMDQGFGVRARNLRADVLDTFTTTYELRTLKDGAIVKEWPGQFSLWFEDSDVEGGYSLAKSSASEPGNEEIFDLFDELTDKRLGKVKSQKMLGFVNGVLGFFQGMSRL